jgi:hypothetical protein
LFQWRKKPEKWQRVEGVVTFKDAADGFCIASESMSRLNLNAAKLMHKVQVLIFYTSPVLYYLMQVM